jgi:hypothetical protein
VKRIRLALVVGLVVAMMLLSLSGAALAQVPPQGPPANEHNCGGTSSVESIALEGSGQAFGQGVSFLADEYGGVSDFTLANCDNTGP